MSTRNSLFNIELSFQRLKEQLRGPSGTKYKLLKLSAFLRNIIDEPEQKRFYSYYIDLYPHLSQYILEKNWQYLSPHEISNLLEIITVLSESHLFDSQVPQFESIKELLISEMDRMRYFLGEIQVLPGKPELAWLDQLSENSLNIVLLERERDDPGFENGVIHRLNISSSSRGKKETYDKVDFMNMTDSNETETAVYLNKVVATAKSECDRKKIKTHFYNFTYYFDEQEYVYIGVSLGLGAVCLALNSIFKNEGSRYYYKFRNDTVFTGKIDDEGNIEKLEDSTLRLKLKTVFFSPYRKFVFPEDNLEEAKKELEKLKKQFPEKDLQLIPLKNFLSACKNLDIIERFEIGLIEKIKIGYKEHHSTINWTVSSLIFGVIAFFAVLHSIYLYDRNAVYSKVENQKITAYNKYDIKVWESDFKVVYRNQYEIDAILEQFVRISDIDRDGTSEILAIDWFSKDSASNRTIYCYNSGSELKWSHVNKPESVYYNNNLFKDTYRLIRLEVADLEGDGSKEIISLGALSPWFPCKVAKLNNRGEEIASYWNAGNLTDIEIFDLDGDNINEIFCTGISNKKDYLCGILIVFDPEYISGASFLTDPLRNGKPGLEKYYVLFPKTVLTPFNASNQNAARSVKHTMNKTILVEVSDGMGELGDINKPFILYEFDKDMRVINIGTSSAYDFQYNQLLDSNKIKPINDISVYEDSLKNSVRYWDGETFVDYPAMNKHYLLAKDSVEKSKLTPVVK
jgi:hypothetical protein